MHSFALVFVLAALIASRSVQMCGASVSLSKFTVIVAAYAVALTTNATPIAIAAAGTPATRHTRNLRQASFVAIATRASNFAWMTPTSTKSTKFYQS
jgi:hypothetical protein